MAEERYTLEKQLGAGGMGEVWLATDTLLNRPVAVKFLQVTDKQMYKDLFLSEARTLASLQHPNITTIYDAVFDETANRFYIMMEYVEGNTLANLIAQTTGPLPLDTVFEITTGVLQALKYAHSKGFVHRDIKPENIVIQKDHVKLTDFGLAALMSLLAEDENAHVVGTPAYMPPEQIIAEGIDGRTDLYALGVTLFEMVTGGRRPFEAEDRYKLIQAHVEEAPPSVREFVPTLPLKLDQIIEKLLAKHPDDRYDSAEALFDALKSLQARQKFSQRYLPLLDPDARPLVERDKLLKKMEAVWQETQQANKPHLLVVRGEMGVGKSRLIAEFLANDILDKGLVAIVGRCNEVKAPYTPFAEILASIFDRGLVKPATLNQQMDQILEQIPSLAALLNIQLPARPAREKRKAATTGLWQTLSSRVPQTTDDPLQSQWQFFSTVLSILSELGPAALFLDDAALLDEASAALIRYLLRQGQLPLLIIAECLDGGQPVSWLSSFPPDEIDQINVLPLPAAAVKQYLINYLGGPVSEAMVNAVEKRARGNPLQIEEITGQLLESDRNQRVALQTGRRVNRSVSRAALAIFNHSLHPAARKIERKKPQFAGSGCHH